MISPSASILINFVDVYRATNATDADGGFLPSYTLVTRSLACSIQFDEISEEVDANSGQRIVDANSGHRITELHNYTLIFGKNPQVRPRDKLLWTDDTGTVRTLFVQATENCAGRNAAWAIKAIERL